MIQIAYTNSNCSDVWEIFQKQTLRHSSFPLYIISDSKPENHGYKDEYIYDNSSPYYKVWVDALKKFNTKYFIYLQEDFLLYENVDTNKIEEYLNFLDSRNEYSFIRLIKSGHLNNNKITDTLYEIESNNQNIFAMQATIWRTDDYIRLMEEVKDSKWLENEKYVQACVDLGIKGLYHYDGEIKRGGAHYDSNVYPYIATALVKGKWNITEYRNELSKILEEYKINLNKRGIF